MRKIKSKFKLLLKNRPLEGLILDTCVAFSLVQTPHECEGDES